MAILAFAHLCDDINQSYIAALLPFLVALRHIDFHSAAELILAANIASSVVQPAVGLLADAVELNWLVPLGLLLAGTGVAALGFAPNLPDMLLCALLSGIGIAMFHPEGARVANQLSGSRKASGMRWFSAGGNAGFAIGPAFAGLSVSAFGLHGTAFAILPAAVMAAIVYFELRRIRTTTPDISVHASAIRAAGGRDNWSAFGRLSVFVTLRSTAFIGLVAFVPLYFVHVLGASPMIAATALTIMLAAGAGGTILGGPLADTHGRKAVLLWSTGCSALYLAAIVPLTQMVTSDVVRIPAAILAFALLGAMIVASQASFVVLGQEYLPNRIGLASGVTLGLAISLGGIASPILGALADAHGLNATMYALALLALSAFAAAWTLPKESRTRVVY